VLADLDIPEDLHRQLMSIARETSRSLDETIADLIRRGLRQGPVAGDGLPVFNVGRVITSEDVRSLEDDW
jgi:hypothetical protein